MAGRAVGYGCSRHVRAAARLAAMPHRLRSKKRTHRTELLAGRGQAWLLLLVISRLVASALAAALVIPSGLGLGDVALLLYGPLSTAALVALPALRVSRTALLFDALIVLAFVLSSGDWRSPYYPLWLTTLALPAVRLPLRAAAVLTVVAPLVFLGVALIGGPAPGDLNVVSETFAIHLVLPAVLVAGLAYAAETLRQLREERARAERLAIERERQRIAWQLHDSAKQRLHAAHLLVSSLRDRAEPAVAPVVHRAVAELESAAADMDTSLEELRSPLLGRPLSDALRHRARELATAGTARIVVRGTTPPLPPLVEAHAYRIGCEALTNALRHADADTIEITVEHVDRTLRLHVRDDGRGLPESTRRAASGLLTMESRAASIGGRLAVGSGDGRGTLVALEVPLDQALEAR